MARKKSGQWSTSIKHCIQNQSPALNLSHKRIGEIPSEIYEMHWLRRLDLSQNDISSVSPKLYALTQLEELDLWGNDGFELSDAVTQLSNLRVLSVGPHSQLPHAIARCSKLEELAIGNNDLRSLPKWLLELRRMKRLVLWENDLTDIPGELFTQMPDLRTLILHRNKLTRLPDEIGTLSHLDALLLHENRIRSLSESMRELTSMRVLTLGLNQIESIPTHVASEWQSLEVLVINNDPGVVVHVEPLFSTKLSQQSRTVTVRGSAKAQISGPLKSLPLTLSKLPNLKYLILYGNRQLGLPEELVGTRPSPNSSSPWEGSVGNILEYLSQTNEGSKPLNEAKLIVLGWGGAGKTSVVNRLVHNKFDPSESRTQGIEVTLWSIQLDDRTRATLNVWDFGGQEIMHATHQFFLTSRCTYLLVLNGRSGSADSDAEYWLRIIESFAPESPVVIAMNQIEHDPFDLDEIGIQQRYPNVQAFVRTDCSVGDEGVGIPSLRAALASATAHLPDLATPFPAAWVEVKDRLSQMTDDYLTFSQYRNVCDELGEVDPGQQERLAGFLHSLGIALNYREDARLRDTNVLNPHWVTEGIYAILNSREVAEQAGELRLGQLSEILPPSRYPEDRHLFLLDLMQKFELCFTYSEDDTRYLVPELLPKGQPLEVGELARRASLQFEYHYPIVPEGLIPRFIVRSHIHSEGNPRWRNGVVLRWEGSYSVVRADFSNRKVSIRVGGSPSARRRLLAVIRSDFDHIHRNYSFTITPMVPVTRPEPMTINYSKLVEAERVGMAKLQEFTQGRFVELDVEQLLNGLDLARPDRNGVGPRAADPVRIFISYSHRDERHRKALDSQLKLLQTIGSVESWHDRRIDPGGDWKGEIARELDQADIALCLLSADFLASDYCYDIELARALDLHRDNRCVVVPVVLRDCQWTLTPLADIQAIPRDGKPIMNYSSRDTAWREVGEAIQSLSMLIKQRKATES